MDIILQDLDPRETFAKWFKENPEKRPDGRGFTDFPQFSSQIDIISSAEGSALVKFGETLVVSTLKTEVVEPELANPDQGFIVVNFHLAAGARSDVKPGPPVEEVQEITDRLAKNIKRPEVFDQSALCLAEGQLVRVLYLDAVCLNDSGNAFETALLASMLALKNAKLHVPELNEQTGMVYINDKENRQSLEIKSWPVSLNFGLFNKSIALLFPSIKETKACADASIRVVFDLFSGSILELDKNSLVIEDAIIPQMIQPVISSFSAHLQSLLQ